MHADAHGLANSFARQTAGGLGRKPPASQAMRLCFEIWSEGKKGPEAEAPFLEPLASTFLE